MDIYNPLKWIDIDGYDVPYRLTDMGVLVKPAHVDAAGKKRKSIVITPQYHLGVAVVRLLKKGERKHERIAHLVSKYFLGCTMDRFYVRYKDGNSENNAADNLECLPYANLAIIGAKAMSRPVAFWRESEPKVIWCFPSIQSASRSLGISHSALKHALDKDRGKVGIGQGKRDGDGYCGSYV